MPAVRVEIEPFAVDRGDCALRGESAGSGEPVLLLHGLTATRRYVLHGSRILERSGWRTIAYDARGHGESGGPHDPAAYDYDALISDALAILDHAGAERAALAGNSMGAATAVGVALRHPERVSGLVLITPAHLGAPSHNQARWDRLGDALAQGGVDGFLDAYGTPSVPGRFAETVLKVVRQRLERHPDRLALAAALKGITRTAAFDGVDALAAVRAPTLVVGSRDDTDPDHPLEIAREYVERIPEARLILEEPGESPLAWRGGSLSRAIASFLADPGHD
jgi:pimeloyl-ACP methyl ester carboxylesterase